MSRQQSLVEILDDEDEEGEASVQVINICPTEDDTGKDMDSSDDLSVMQQYYSASPPSKNYIKARNAANSQRIKSKNGDHSHQNLRKDEDKSSATSKNGPVSVIASIQSLASNVDRAMSSAKQLPPESVFNISSKNGPIPMEISSHGMPVPSRITQTKPIHQTDKNDNLILPDSRRIPPSSSRMESHPRLPSAHLGMPALLPHPPRHFLERPDLHPAYGRPMYPSYGYPYYAPYFPPPAPPPLSSVPHGPPPPRMPGLVCRVAPPADVGSNSPVFGVIQREQDKSGQVKTFFLCDFCQLKCQDQEAFLNHALTHMFVCTECGQQTFSRIQLISHMGKRHPDHYAKLGHLETMQVARLGLRANSQLDDPDTSKDEVTEKPSTSDTPPSPESSSSSGTLAKGQIQGVTVQDDGFTSCDLCKVTTENSDMVLWSAHVYLHQFDSAMRIHCTICGRFTPGPEEMLDHFCAMHGEKRVGVTFAAQAVSNSKLVYVWFCPHCRYNNESLAKVTEHLQAEHALADPKTYPSIKAALEMDLKESLLERTAGVNTSLDLEVPSLSNWTCTDGSMEPSPESFVHSPSLMMERSPERPPSKISEPSGSGNNLAALKSMYDSMIVRTRMIADLIIAAKDYYTRSNSVYSCRRCPYRTRHKHLVAEHLWHHMPGSKWACNYCTFINKRRRNVVDHLKNKHRDCAPKLIVQVPTVIDFDNKPMNVQQLNVARKSTSVLNRHARSVINVIHSEAKVVSTPPSSISAQLSEDSRSKTPEGTTLRSVLQASTTKKSPLPSSTPKKTSPNCNTRDGHSNSATPVLSPSSSQSSLLEMSRVGRFPMSDDSSSCWVCNVCHRKDERWAVMRNHLMFAHPDLYSNECLALSRVKKPMLDVETLTLEANGNRRMMQPSLLSVEKIFMYPHLLTNSDANAGKVKQVQDMEPMDEGSNDAITLDTSGESGEVLLLEVSDESADEEQIKPKITSAQKPGYNLLKSPAKKLTVAKKSTTSAHFKNSSVGSKNQSAKKSTGKRATSGVNSSNENGSALYGCVYCQMKFPDSLTAREHLMGLHRNQQPLVINLQQVHNPNVSRIYLCTSYKCSYSTFNEGKFKMHVVKHGSGDFLEDDSSLLL